MLLLPDNNLYQCQIVGAGPAGIGMLTALYNAIATTSGDLKARYQGLLESLVMIEANDVPGGLIGSYQINANTNAADAVTAIKDGSPLATLRDQYLKLPEIEKVLIALPRLDELLVKPLSNKIVELLGDRLKCRRRVSRIVKSEAIFSSFDSSGELIASSHNLLTCCGGTEELLSELQPWADKTCFGGEFLQWCDADRLPGNPGPVVITSASHSGFSCVWRLLEDALFTEFTQGRDIVVLQRQSIVKLRCTPAFADDHQLDWNEENDLCRRTGLVYASAGLRKDAKFLYLKIRDGEEPRVRILHIERLTDQSELLDQAALIIQCAGFIAKMPEIEIDGKTIRVKNNSKYGEVSDADSGEVIPGLFACGLGMHILPENEFHGEKSFNGSLNGLQSYPLAITPGIIEQMIKNQ